MAFEKTIVERSFWNGKRVEKHTFKAAGVTTGVITSEIRKIEYVSLKNNTLAFRGKAEFSGSDVTVSTLTAEDAGSVLIIGV